MARLTHAPELSSLAELGYEWRHVAHNPGFGEITIWFGDLAITKFRLLFHRMIREGKIISVTNRTPDGGDVFAKMSTQYDAHKVHTDSVLAADRAERMKRNPFMRHYRARVRNA